MKYPPFSPISIDESSPAHENDYAEHELYSSHDTPLYISFSIEENVSDIKDVTSASSIAENESEDYSSKQKSSSSTPEEPELSSSSTPEEPEFSFANVSNTPVSMDGNRQAYRSGKSSKTCSPKPNDQEKTTGHSFRAVCYACNGTSAALEVNQIVPSSPADTVVANNTRRKNAIARSRDSDSTKSNLGVDNVAGTNMDKSIQDQNFLLSHHIGYSQKSNGPEPSDHRLPLSIQTDIDTRMDESSARIVASTNEINEKETSSLLHGCLFETCSHKRDSNKCTISQGFEGDNKESCDKGSHSGMPDLNVQRDEVETEECIEVCVSNPDSPQREIRSGACFLKTIGDKASPLMNMDSYSSGYNSSLSSVRYCDVMLSPSSHKNGEYSLTVVPIEPQSSKSISIQKYTVSSILVKPPKACNITNNSNQRPLAKKLKSGHYSKPRGLLSRLSKPLKSHHSATYSECDTVSTLSQNLELEKLPSTIRHHRRDVSRPAIVDSSDTVRFKLNQGIIVGKTSMISFKKKKRATNHRKRSAGTARMHPTISSSYCNTSSSSTRHIYRYDTSDK